MKGLLTAILLTGSLFHHSAHADGISLRFDGESTRATVPHHESLNPERENWTCSFWVKLESDFAIGHSKFIAKRDGAGSAGGFYIGSRFAPACDDGERVNLDYRQHIPLGE